MSFYTVWVRSLGYRGASPLTYRSDQNLKAGQIVQVPLQNENVLGFVETSVPKPNFPVKPVRQVYDIPPLPGEILKLSTWMLKYYASSVGVITSQVLPHHLPTHPKYAEPVVNKSRVQTLPPLTVEQLHVVESITKADTYLLHGRTGSGKTRVYLELAGKVASSGKSCLVLTPEIGLTSQLAHTFQQSFPGQVVILHSKLTSSERQKVWLRILSSAEPLIVIGPRSALFTPLSNVGLIVIDEAHEPAYKQEQAPYYHARTVASKLAEIHSATLIIGSATPSVSDYYMASLRSKPVLRMKSLAQASDEKIMIKVEDIKERSSFSRSPHLSDSLIESIHQSLARHEQSLLYLNRRGTARTILCDNCGWQALCPHCDLPLIYHADSGRFRCHTCGYGQAILINCPVCGNPSITFRSVGTKALVEEVRRIFPEATVQRFDADNKKSERFEQQYSLVKEGAVDILVGTQMLAKGLDLPKLSTLGIVLADSSLYMPDFSAQERTYQLISQALGRVGRGHTNGYAIIQTYNPQSAVLRAAVNGDWETFYSSELSERKKFHFPPFYFLLKLSCRRASYAAAEKAAIGLKQNLERTLEDIEIDGPSPAFHEKSHGKYHCQLIIKSTRRARLLQAIKQLPSGWTYDIDPLNLL